MNNLFNLSSQYKSEVAITMSCLFFDTAQQSDTWLGLDFSVLHIWGGVQKMAISFTSGITENLVIYMQEYACVASFAVSIYT